MTHFRSDREATPWIRITLTILIILSAYVIVQVNDDTWQPNVTERHAQR